MNIKFRQGSEELSKKLIGRAETKLAKLSRLIPEGNYEAQVYVDVERESGSSKSNGLWRASINLDAAGDHFNAVSIANTPGKATEVAIKELKREIGKAKEKRSTITRRGNEFLKRLRQNAVA